jgi:hypothetical protein
LRTSGALHQEILRDAIRNVGNAVAALSARLATLEASHRRATRRIGDLEDRVDDHSGRLTALECQRGIPVSVESGTEE